MTTTKSTGKALCKQLSVIPVLGISLFFFSTKIIAQDTISYVRPKHTEVPSTKTGITAAELAEYNEIVDKAKNEKGYPDFKNFSEADKNKLELLFLSMSKEQQEKQIIVFRSAPPPFQKSVPTKEQIESWKNSKIYGLWIDNKRVSNSELNKYSNTDFAHMFVSKLSKNAINYGKHYYQVDLMTTGYYTAYYKQATDNRQKYHMSVRIRNRQV